MSMGDGTFMADNAFRESIPVMSYTPEELGINMDAYAMATETAGLLRFRQGTSGRNDKRLPKKSHPSKI